MCEEVPRQNAAESRKIPESGSVIPREGVESISIGEYVAKPDFPRVIPREGVESIWSRPSFGGMTRGDPERGS